MSRRRGLMFATDNRDASTPPNKICVTSTGASVQAPVDPRFGRCAYFLVTDGSHAEPQVFENTARGLGNGAGIQAAQTLANIGVTVVLTGDLGPNAFRVLRTTGIRAFRTSGGTVHQAIADFLAGRLTEIQGPTGPGHHGRGGFGPQWRERGGRP
jgi:predicted Fe-Mo cluster-binding NifX family protein